MKKQKGFFDSLPINSLAAAAIAVFFLQVLLVLYYNNFSLTFPNIETFRSFEKAAKFADSGFKSFAATGDAKETQGIIYPVIISAVYKLAGKASVITFAYIFAFAVFFISAAAFYKVSREVLPQAGLWPVLLVFSTMPYIILGAYSGGDGMLVLLLLSLNLYYSVFGLKNGSYTGAVVTAVLLLLTTRIGMAFGAAALLFAGFKYMEKGFKKDAPRMFYILLGVSFILMLVFSAFTFIDKFAIESLQEKGILNTRTFMVDTFFKDGFLWSKAVCPLLALFFFFAVFTGTSKEMSDKKAGFYSYAAMITAAALSVEMTAVFSDVTVTHLYMAPFFIVLGIAGLSGAAEISELLAGNNKNMKNAVFYSVIAFIILFNFMLYFSRTVENNNKIKFIAYDRTVQNFVER